MKDLVLLFQEEEELDLRLKFIRSNIISRGKHIYNVHLREELINTLEKQRYPEQELSIIKSYHEKWLEKMDDFSELKYFHQIAITIINLNIITPSSKILEEYSKKTMFNTVANSLTPSTKESKVSPSQEKQLNLPLSTTHNESVELKSEKRSLSHKMSSILRNSKNMLGNSKY